MNNVNLDECVDRAVCHLDAAVRARFAADPHGTLRGDLGLTARAAEHLSSRRGDGGVCDGVSFLRDDVILYAPTPFSRRENFTLAHELGHWLVEQADELYDWLADQPEPGRLLETLCDRIAQQLVLPASAVDLVLNQGSLQAHHVLALYRMSHASIPACAIGLAGRLPHVGAVVIADHETVQYASVQPDVESGWPVVIPWPGQAVPDGHPFRTMQAGSELTRKTFWSTAWGEREDYYVDAVSDGKRIIAIFSDIDTWNCEQLHLDQPREFDQRPIRTIHCCQGEQAVRGYPCPDCGEPFCPICGKCRCQRAAAREQPCSKCTLNYQPQLLVDGLCVECRD
ncbi:ImmA/IrrE family metallo-endopeptidase [Amycolatopsis thermoflava]|uniref:ImmA/IrrE family metallo-endopeptidase n=1 Tax=Amycolatopsis thermoflava TaxID=84480 RepID=UPI001428A8DB|nr:ImmA/IrrE family metallo-endopeptidase [Amycolatopsis thermoflava]